MSDNREVGHRIFEAFDTGNTALLDESVAEDYIDHAIIPGLPAGRPGLAAFIEILRGAFPDMQYRIEREWEDGDTVISYAFNSGTNTGSLFGMPPTGKRAEWPEIHIARYSGGMLVEHWAVVGQAEMLQQLGVIPAPSAPAGA